MKNMKKLLALLLALAMILALAACGGSSTEQSSQTAEAEDTAADSAAEAEADNGGAAIDTSDSIEPEELGSGTVKWSESRTSDSWMLVTNDGGKTLGYSPNSGVSLIQVDGYAFKDLNRNGMLEPYEDWRLDNETRAADLTYRMSVDEITPLFTHGGWMSFGSTIEEGSTDYDYILAGGRGGVTRSATSPGNTGMAVTWNNALQALCETTGNWGIPAVISVDPNHFNYTTDQESLAATFDTDLAFRLGVEHGKQYRAVGVTMLLGPQIDIITSPIWSRAGGAYTEDPALARDLADAYISGLQSTWAEDGTDLGWGEDSVYAIAKHFVGSGAAEGGRNDHGDSGKYMVYPGNNFAAHLIPFFDGAFNLTRSSTGVAGVMPNYGITYSRDMSLGDYVGGAYSEYRMGLLEENGYDGYILTDWQITVDGAQSFGVEDLTVAERFALLYATGVDSVGGTSDIEGAAEGYELFADEVGEDAALDRLHDVAYSFILVEMELGLFDNPYLDTDEAFDEVWNADTDAFSLELQEKSVIMLKNSDSAISETDEGAEKKTVYVPYVFTAGSAGNASSAAVASSWDPSMDLSTVAKYFNVVTDTVGEPSGAPVDNSDASGEASETSNDDGGATYTKDDIIRATAAELADCDYALVMINAPSSGSMQDANGNWLPASLQFEEYTATTARRESIAGDVTVETINDGYYGTKTQETKENRSYYGNTASRANNYSDYELLQSVAELVPDSCKIVLIVCGTQPMVWSEVEPLADVILYYYGGSEGGGAFSWFFDEALLNIISGQVEPYALLNLQQPASMEAVEAQDEDVPRDMECYVDADGNTYDFAFGLNWSGVIDDERVQTYSADPLTMPENIEFHYAN